MACVYVDIGDDYECIEIRVITLILSVERREDFENKLIYFKVDNPLMKLVVEKEELYESIELVHPADDYYYFTPYV